MSLKSQQKSKRNQKVFILFNKEEKEIIDFTNASYIKLGKVNPSSLEKNVDELLIDGESIFSAYKGMRDFVVFTNKRIITVNVQGLTGKKVDYTSLPYSKITAYSIETAGTFDLDSELELWFSGLGKVKLEFKGNVDIKEINRVISNHCL